MMHLIQKIYPRGYPAPGPVHVDIEFSTLRSGYKFRVGRFQENCLVRYRHCNDLGEAINLCNDMCEELSSRRSK